MISIFLPREVFVCFSLLQFCSIVSQTFLLHGPVPTGLLLGKFNDKCTLPNNSEEFKKQFHNDDMRSSKRHVTFFSLIFLLKSL